MIEPDIRAHLTSAAQAQASGQIAVAIKHWQTVLSYAPGNPVALNALGLQALAGGRYGEAIILFTSAVEADSGAPPLLLNLAKAQRLNGDPAGERRSLQRTLEINQLDLTALIRLAELHERLGEEAQANRRWAAVISVAASVENPSDELSTLLSHARKYVADRTQKFANEIDSALGSLVQGLDRSQRRRFDACIDHALGRRAIYANHCDGIHFPFLPADEFFERDQFPWLPQIEAHTPVIRAELANLLRNGAPGFAPYVAFDSGTPETKWSKLDQSLDWSAYHLWRFGVRDNVACARCPQTAAAIEALPLAKMPARAPTAFFSMLKPGAHIPPHTGVSNVRAIVHLPLIVPPGCAFRVGGETREWQEGQAFAFDDTIEHEAWNRSDQVRAVLIFDVWNPHLTEIEQGLLQRYFDVAESSSLNPGASPPTSAD